MRLVKFMIAGGIGALVNLAVMYVLTEAGLYYPISYAIAFQASVVVCYLINSRLAFRDYHSGLAGFGRYLFTSTFTLGINLGILAVLVSVLGIWYMLATVAAILVSFIINFTLGKRFVWNKARYE